MCRGSHVFIRTSRISYIRVRLCSEHTLSTAKLGAELLQTGSAVCSIKRVNLALPIAQSFLYTLVLKFQNILPQDCMDHGSCVISNLQYYIRIRNLGIPPSLMGSPPFNYSSPGARSYGASVRFISTPNVLLKFTTKYINPV